RFPDVLLPPQPTPQRQPRRTVPTRVVLPPKPIQPRPFARQQSNKPAQRRAAPAEVVLEVDRGASSPSPIASVAPSSARPVAQGVGAPAIARWLVPGTLRKQFILTEVLQAPLALREERRV
ncbi:MAG: hypothetical protein ABIP55_04390, partial [Tepidisphaeraceae bacterium]